MWIRNRSIDGQFRCCCLNAIWWSELSIVFNMQWCGDIVSSIPSNSEGTNYILAVPTHFWHRTHTAISILCGVSHRFESVCESARDPTAANANSNGCCLSNTWSMLILRFRKLLIDEDSKSCCSSGLNAIQHFSFGERLKRLTHFTPAGPLAGIYDIPLIMIFAYSSKRQTQIRSNRKKAAATTRWDDAPSKACHAMQCNA